MSHLPSLIQDLGLILIAAAVMTLLFKWLRQPVVLGYLIAGYIVSEYFPNPWLCQYLPEFVPQMLQVHDKESIHLWSEIGVIFMLFGLGLEFSFKKLLAVGRTAVVAGGFEVCLTTALGFVVGKLFGWNNMDSIFFGAMLAMSSTTIIVKVFDELKLKGKAFAPIVFGALIVEDLLAILLLVLLSSIAVSQQVAGGELLFSSLKLVFFLVLWFLMGIFLLPWFFKRCRNLLNDEILLIVSVGLCFSMVIIACKVGFSAALGAFVMGSLLAETTKGTRIEHVTLPVKDLFSAVFFVSVGMMIDPTILWEYAGTITIIAVVTVVAKFFGTGVGALLAGCSLRNSMQSGLSMAQIGEFSFIIATLGKSLGVISDFLYPVAVAVSAVTTLTTPYLILSSDTISKWLNARIPERAHLLLLRYEIAMNETTGKEHVLALLWRVHGLAIMLNAVMILGIALGIRFAARMVADPTFGLLPAFLAAAIASPFFCGIFRGQARPATETDPVAFDRLLKLQFGVSVVRFLIGLGLAAFLVGCFLPPFSFAGLVCTAAVVALLLIFRRFPGTLYRMIESRFVSHLSEKERAVVEDRSALPHLAPWEATLTEYTLSEYSPLVLQSLQNSRLKQDFGVTVAILRRGEKNIVAPRGEEVLLPRDKLFLIGTYDQLVLASDIIERQPGTEMEFDDENFGMIPLRLTKEHSFIGKPIRECGLRESVNGLIVGLEREEKRFLNPDPSMVLQNGDVIWLVGDKKLLKKIGQTPERISPNKDD